jgi:hypothetical protein
MSGGWITRRKMQRRRQSGEGGTSIESLVGNAAIALQAGNFCSSAAADTVSLVTRLG